MNERLLRKYIRKMLIEQAGIQQEPNKQITSAPKGVWTLLSSGDPTREEVKEHLYNMVIDAYADIGGHVKISEPDSLDRYMYWIVNDIDEDDEIDVLMFGKPDPAGGNKMGGAATDGTKAAKSAYKDKSAELRAGGTVGGVGGWWGEVSGVPAYALISRGAPAVEDEAMVAQLLAGDKYIWHGAHPDADAPEMFKRVNGWYTKDFGPGGKHTKIIIGIPR